MHRLASLDTALFPIKADGSQPLAAVTALDKQKRAEGKRAEGFRASRDEMNIRRDEMDIRRLTQTAASCVPHCSQSRQIVRDRRQPSLH